MRLNRAARSGSNWLAELRFEKPHPLMCAGREVEGPEEIASPPSPDLLFHPVGGGPRKCIGGRKLRSAVSASRRYSFALASVRAAEVLTERVKQHVRWNSCCLESRDLAQRVRTSPSRKGPPQHQGLRGRCPPQLLRCRLHCQLLAAMGISYELVDFAARHARIATEKAHKIAARPLCRCSCLRRSIRGGSTEQAFRVGIVMTCQRS